MWSLQHLQVKLSQSVWVQTVVTTFISPWTAMDGTNKSSHQRVFAWYFNFMVLGVVWIMPLIFTSLEVWQSPVQIKLGSGPLGKSKAENPRCNTWGWGYKLTGAYNIMAWIGHESTSKTGYAARHQEVKYFGSCSQSSSERPIGKQIRKTSGNMKHYETAQNCKKSDSGTQEVLLQSMNLTVRLITNSSARLAICSAFCGQPMTAKLLQAYLKMYTFAHCLHLSSSLSPGPTNPPNSGSACCAGRCHGLSIRLAFKFAHFERDQSRKKKWPESTGMYGEKQKLHSIRAHSISQLWLHSMQFMLGGPSWKSPCGYPKETSTCLMKAVQNQLFPKRIASKS